MRRPVHGHGVASALTSPLWAKGSGPRASAKPAEAFSREVPSRCRCDLLPDRREGVGRDRVILGVTSDRVAGRRMVGSMSGHCGIVRVENRVAKNAIAEKSQVRV